MFLHPLCVLWDVAHSNVGAEAAGLPWECGLEVGMAGS